MPELLSQSWMLSQNWIPPLYYLPTTLKPIKFSWQLQKNQIKYSSNFMRIWNEGATLFLFAIVFLAIVKSAIHWIFMVIGSFGPYYLF